jgi:predicted RNase H-like nuclease (RuvC/YqgF family)
MKKAIAALEKALADITQEYNDYRTWKDRIILEMEESTYKLRRFIYEEANRYEKLKNKFNSVVLERDELKAELESGLNELRKLFK